MNASHAPGLATTFPPPPPGFRLVHHDERILLADKPADFLCVPGRGPQNADCLSARVQADWPDALVVHRLDMATSGLVLFARGTAMQRALSIAFAQRQMQKRYEAVVDGLLAEDTGEITLPLAADWPNRPLQRIDPVGGKPSCTRWQVISRHTATATAASTTRLALQPVTGRTHQLRLHLAAIGHPILGDVFYAPPLLQAAAPRLLLHACHLAWQDEAGDHVFDSPVPF